MTFNINPRESISRSDAFYDNKFRVYAEEPRLKESRLRKASDTIESESSKKEKLLADKFRQGIFNFDLGIAKYTKQVGRFIFVAITKPLYFVAITAPAYVIQYALPFLQNMAGNFQNKFSEASAAISQWILSVSGIMQEWFNKFFRKKMERFENLLKSSKDFLKKRFQKRLNALKRLYEKLEQNRPKWAFKKPKFHFKLPKVTFKLPKFQFPKMKWPKFKLLKISLPYKKLLNPLKRFGKTSFSILKAVGGFFFEIALANYEIWIAPWVRRAVRLYQWSSRKLKAFEGFLKAKCQKLLSKLPSLPAMPGLPKIELPKINLPKVQLPKFEINLPRFKLPNLAFKLPKLPSPIPRLKKPLKRLQSAVNTASLYIKVFIKVLFEQLS